MQTVDLGDVVDDAGLEGVVLGMVFSAVRDQSGQGFSGGGGGREGELRKERRRDGREFKGKGGEEVLACLDEAIRKVGERRQMEGVMEFESGRLSFLVYRVD